MSDDFGTGVGITVDGVGNRLTMDNAGFVTYSYDANNKLTQLVGPSGTTTFDYDDNGNMTVMDPPGAGSWDYQYDYENRLVGVTDNSAYTGTYTYSGDGLRLRVQETNHTYTDRWLQYDGVRPVLEGTLSGDTYTTTAKYVWEGNSYYDPLLFALEGGAWKHPMTDRLGSTRQLLDNTTQNVTDTYEYEAFGNLMSSTGSTPNPYKYVGSLGYYATGSSLLHLGARYYMPEIGRFLQRDPLLSGTSGTPMSTRTIAEEPYLYAANNPINMQDPAGLFSLGMFARCLRCHGLALGWINLAGCGTVAWPCYGAILLTLFLCAGATGGYLACVALGGRFVLQFICRQFVLECLILRIATSVLLLIRCALEQQELECVRARRE